jgi:hypothetical protein
MRMVGRFFVMSAFMVLSCFAVVTRGVRMVFCRLFVVLGCFLRHGVCPVLGCAQGKALSLMICFSSDIDIATGLVSEKTCARVLNAAKPDRAIVLECNGRDCANSMMRCHGTSARLARGG